MAAPGRRFFISSPLPAIRLSGAKVVMLTGGRLASAAASSAAIASAVVITGWAELAAAGVATLAVDAASAELVLAVAASTVKVSEATD